MSGMLKKAFQEGETIIGKPTKDFNPDVKINGVGIAGRHCVIAYDP